MSVLETDKIDVIGTDKKTNQVILTISDHLDWEDSDLHLEILQDKLNSYIAFIESGQIIEKYPKSKGNDLIIEIVSQYEYEEIGKEFLEKIKPVLHSLNIKINQRVI